MGASLRDRAARALHRAALRLGHPASIPCADIFERPIAVGLISADEPTRRLEVYLQYSDGALRREISTPDHPGKILHWAAVFPPLTATPKGDAR
jgi:hypothetical protein